MKRIPYYLYYEFHTIPFILLNTYLWKVHHMTYLLNYTLHYESYTIQYIPWIAHYITHTMKYILCGAHYHVMHYGVPIDVTCVFLANRFARCSAINGLTNWRLVASHVTCSPFLHFLLFILVAAWADLEVFCFHLFMHQLFLSWRVRASGARLPSRSNVIASLACWGWFQP